MRHALANLVLASTTLAGGCSLLYNPNDLPKQPDAMPDMEMVVDANVSALQISGVGPIALIEGQGDGGSRKPVLVIEGTDIAQTNVTVEIVASPGATRTPKITLDSASQQIDVYGHHIAIPITAMVDPDLPANEVIPLDVTVTQDAGGTPISSKLSGILTLKGRAEYENTGTTVPALADGVNEFSRVNLTMGTIPKPSSGPVIIEATASINIAASVVATFDGSSTGPGPGGFDGGTGATAGLGIAAGGTGKGDAGGAGVSGAAGASAMEYKGDDQLTTIDVSQKSANASSGGGGGGVTTASVGGGGKGGGGGGTIALTAGGSVTIEGTISAKGGAGAPGGTLAFAGGPGSGGIILVRGGGDVSVATLDVGGPGPVGRVRVDAGGVRTVSGTAYQGPTFVNLPLIINEEKPTFDVQGSASTGIRYIVIRGTDIEGPIDLTMGSNGRATITLQRPLQQGINEICLLVESAAAATYTRNCATVAHIYKTP
jgi:hypothetical protein